MIATTHLAVGAAVGLWASRMIGGLVGSESTVVQTAVQVSSAFIAGTVSHFVLDAIPHSEAIYNSRYGEWPVLAVELLIIFSVVLWMSFLRNLNMLIIFFGMTGAAWPDLFYMLSAWFPEGNRLVNLVNQFHSYCHASFQLTPIYSLPMQFIIAVVAILFLF